MSTKAKKPTFDPDKIEVNGEKQTKLAKKAKLHNEAVAMFKKKKGKLTVDDLEELNARKEEREKNTK